jgi:DNA-binding protein HU-beta
MNRRELIRAVAAQTAEDVRHVEAIVSGLTDVVTAVVAKGEPVTVQGFAKFAKVERAARMGRNPRTGEQIRIKASKRVRVTPMKAFKDMVMAPSQAPRLARGVWPTSPELLSAQAAERKDAARPTAQAPARTTTARAVATKKATTKRAATTRSATKATTRAATKKATTKRAATTRAATTRTPAARTAKRGPATRSTAKKTTRRAR